MHSNIVLSLQAIADPTLVSPQKTRFVPDRRVGQIDSDSGSDLGLEIAYCQVADQGMGDMRHNSDERTFPNHRRGDAHRLKILFEVLEADSVMSMTIETPIRQWQITPGTLSHQQPTLIQPAGSSARR